MYGTLHKTLIIRLLVKDTGLSVATIDDVVADMASTGSDFSGHNR